MLVSHVSAAKQSIRRITRPLTADQPRAALSLPDRLRLCYFGESLCPQCLAGYGRTVMCTASRFD